MEVLIALLFALGLITVIGHVIWIMLAAAFRLIFEESRLEPSLGLSETTAQANPGAQCVECGAVLHPNDQFCAVCGRPKSSAGPIVDLAVTARQLGKFLNQGRLDADSYNLLMRVIEEERGRLGASTHPQPIEIRPETEQPLFAPVPVEVSPHREPVSTPAPVEVNPFPETAPTPTPWRPTPSVVQQNVLTHERSIEREGRDLKAVEAIPMATPNTSIETLPGRPPRRSFGEMLETFMEESSIRWGELIGGMLIIGCSIALVVSLWAEITARPFLKFSVFISVTAALFGLGFYSAHSWKLPTTSRGVLIIATLLAPLNFLAMTAFSHETVPASGLVVGAELFSLALFLFLVFQAARVFAPEAPWMTALATMGPSFAMLMARHSAGAQDGWLRTALLGVAPLLCYWVSCGLVLRDRVKRGAPDAPGADRIFIHLGVSSFAALLPLGLIFIKPGAVSQTLRQFAPLACLFGIPSVGSGVTLLRGAEDKQTGKTQTAATSLILVGSLISLAALVFAWPNAIAVVITALINCAVCLSIALASSRNALRYDLRLAHVGAMAHLSLATLTVANLFSGNVVSWTEDTARLAGSFISLTSGVALAALFSLFAIASEWSLKKERKVESRVYAIGSLAIGVFSLLLITTHGFGRVGDPYHAAPGYAFFALAALVIAWRRANPIASWVGSALLLLTIAQSLAFKFGHELASYHPVRLSFLVFANVGVFAAVIANRHGERARRIFSESLTSSALAASLGVAPFLALEGWMSNSQICGRTLWLAGIWLAIAWLRSWPVLFAAFQFMLASSAVFGTAALFGHRWPRSFVGDLKTLQAQAVALALMSLAWVALRLLLRKLRVIQDAPTAELQENESDASRPLFNPRALSQLLYPGWPGVDRVITWSLLAFLSGLSLIGVQIGLGGELRLWNSSVHVEELAKIALGGWSWTLLLSLSLVFIAGLWERFEKSSIFALLALLACSCLLLAGRGTDGGFTVPIYRWSSAIAFALVSASVIFRNRVARWIEPFNWPQVEDRSAGLAAALRTLSLVLFVAPVMACSLGVIREVSIGAEYPGWPVRLGMIVKFVGPLLIVGLSFVAYAIRERSASYACAASWTANIAATFSYLLWIDLNGASIDRAHGYMLAQLNIVVTAACSFLWISAHRRQSSLGSAWDRSDAYLRAQTALALLAALTLLAVASLRIFADPWSNSLLADSLGGLTGIFAVTLSAIAYAQIRGTRLENAQGEQLGVGLLAIGSLLVCVVSRFVNDTWAAYHTLLAVLSVTAWLMLALRWLALSANRERPEDAPRESFSRGAKLGAAILKIGVQRSLKLWITSLAFIVVALVFRGNSSPGEPWWTAGFSISTCLLFVGLSITGRSRGYLYFAAAAINYAITKLSLWLDHRSPGFFKDDTGILTLLAVNAIALSLPAIAWLAIDLKLLRRPSGKMAEKMAEKTMQRGIMPFHKVAASVSIGLCSLLLALQWALYSERNGQAAGNVLLNWLALLSVIALLVACLWDKDSDYAFRGLYGTGLIAIGMTLVSSHLSRDGLLVCVAIALALFTLLTSAIWRSREQLREFASRFRMPLNEKSPERLYSWLTTANGLLAILSYSAIVVVVFLIDSLSQRLLATTVSTAIPISFAFLARFWNSKRLITNVGREVQDGNEGTEGRTQGRGDIRHGFTVNLNGINPGLITVTVWLAILSSILWGWAWLSPLGDLQVVNRVVIVMMIIEAVLIGYRFLISKRLPVEHDWRRGVKAQLLSLTIIGLAALLITVSVEASDHFSYGVVKVAWPVILAVFLTLILLFWTCIAFALAPGQDPFNLSERGRMGYVYGAEGLTVVALLHTRLTLPWLFGGFFLTWWPLVVMALAFTGVGLSEIFHKRGKLVLAEPLERTGILLPLLPALGFWVIHSDVTYSGLLFLVGLFYGVLSVMRRSFTFGILAILAGNGGLWNLLHGIDGYGFYQHPQLWLIPVALSVLVSARVNRDRLTQDQLTMVRYATLMTIYVASTSDIFVNGVSESPWLTIVLAVLSVSGVIAGLMLRVRAFLFLGTAFLLLSMLTLIWTASVHLNWGWLWYVAGIGFGMVILLTALLFDRKRLEMLRLVERLKQWQA
jgi:hypothetical protein